MNDNLKIRFVEQNNLFYIQEKSFFGWHFVSYKIKIEGRSKKFFYSGENKLVLLGTVLKDYFGIYNEKIRIIEYPSIKIYNYGSN